MINEQRQILPIYSTTSFSNVEKQQRFRQVCDGQTGAPRFVSSRYPEFIFRRDFTIDAVSSIIAYDVTNASDSAELYNVSLVNEWQSGSDVYSSFLGKPASPALTCGHWYYYKITVGTDLFYSDIWAAADYSSATPTDGNLELHIAPTCSIGGIPYDQLGGFTHYVTLHSDLVTAEQSEQREQEEDEDFNVVVVSQTVSKRHQGRLVNCPMPLLDWLYTVPLFLNRSTFVAKLAGATDTYTVTDFSVTEVDTSINPCAPTVVFQMRLESDISESCCETNACDLDAPAAPTATPQGGGVVLVSGNIDVNTFANVYYKLSAAGSWTQFGGNFDKSDIIAGVSPSIGAGTFDFKYSMNTFGCTVDSAETTGVVVT